MWNPIIAGVDSSPESARAAAFAADLAHAAGTTCHLVHVTGDQWSDLAIGALPEQAKAFRAFLVVSERECVEHALCDVVAPDVILNMTVRVGRAAAVLKEIAAEDNAGLIVMGGKHHSALARWFTGSTSLDMMRTTEVPVLVTGDSPTPIRRVLVAVDLSAAARPTIEAAGRFAGLFGAELRVVSALEPLPIVPEAPNYDLTHYYAAMEAQLARDVWPLAASWNAEFVTRYGAAEDVILQETADWNADLVVVGSHGKGWVDRLLIGSVTERLVNRLPASLLIVPVSGAVAQEAARRTDTDLVPRFTAPLIPHSHTADEEAGMASRSGSHERRATPMMHRNYVVAAAFAALLAGVQLAAQTDRSVVVGVYGGGYDHLLNLNDAGSAHGIADFTSGHSYGTTVGVQLNRYVALHGDFTFTQTRAQGDESFAGRRFNRFFYGGHVEVGYPLAGGVTPYLFLGGGAVTIDELGSDATISPFTKPAAMFGAGFFYPILRRFELFAEGKQLVYNWDRGGFAPIPWYVTTTEGRTYSVELSTGNFNRTQWDLTYTFGVSYRFGIGTRRPAPAETPGDE